MNIALSPELETMIREKVAAGEYHDASEVVSQALRIMERYEEQLRYKKKLDAALAEGFASIDRGEGIVLTREVWDQIIAEADAMDDGEPLDSLVTASVRERWPNTKSSYPPVPAETSA
jgi:antitoxin ParD1/3/4